MNATEQHINATKKAILEKMAFMIDTAFVELLEKVKLNAEFLDEMNATNGEYKVAFIAEAAEEDAPQIPDLADVEPLPTEQKPLVEKVVEALGMEKAFEQKEEWELVSSEDVRYQKICIWLINSGANEEKLNNFQSEKKVRFTENDRDHLRNLIWYREELFKGKNGAFDLKAILGQNDTLEFEKKAWGELAKNHNLK